MKLKPRKKLNIRKTARFVIWINSMQVAAIAAVLLYVVLRVHGEGRFIEITALTLTALIVTWGAVLDIREAFMATRVSEQARMLEEAYRQLEDLNGTLRKQRHDFMNHLQVVFSLLELKEQDEAMRYVESVYSDIRKTGSVLKTAIPAVNALIAAKRQDCQERGIAFEMVISSGWNDLPVPGWEMCRVLGNLIDNARDALMEQPDRPDRKITLTIGETPVAYRFEVSNNGPVIPKDQIERIFQMGFTTKSEGHGSGLSIVSEILRDCGGAIEAASDESATRFTGTIPKPPVDRDAAQAE